MMAVRYHGCTCHLRYSAANNANNSVTKKAEKSEASGDKSEAADEGAKEDKEDKEEENKSQPWYFHVVASVILVVHGLTFLVPHDPETEDTDMMRIIGRWFGFDWEWMKHFTPYAQVIIILGVTTSFKWKSQIYKKLQIVKKNRQSEGRAELLS